MNDEQPKYHEERVCACADMLLHQRVFTRAADSGMIVGWNMSALFWIESPARAVWPGFKDFNLWQNSYGFHYPAVVGDLYFNALEDLGEERFSIEIERPGEPRTRHPWEYRVLKVIPERLIILSMPVPEDESNGGISPGFHVFLLSEYDGKTLMDIQMQHTARTDVAAHIQMLQRYREQMPNYERFWKDLFIPNLKRLACGRPVQRE